MILDCQDRRFFLLQFSLLGVFCIYILCFAFAQLWLNRVNCRLSRDCERRLFQEIAQLDVPDEVLRLKNFYQVLIRVPEVNLTAYLGSTMLLHAFIFVDRSFLRIYVHYSFLNGGALKAVRHEDN